MNRDIAVVGLSCAFPNARTPHQFWERLRAGEDCIRQVSATESLDAGVPGDLLKHPRYVPFAGIIDEFDCFDASFFGYSPREAELMDPQQRLFLEHCYWALENAGEGDTSRPRSIGVFATASHNTYLLNNLLSRPELRDLSSNQQVLLGNAHDSVATRAAYKLNLSGPAMTVQCGCSSALVAVHLARVALLTHQCDAALAGGVSVAVPHHAGYLYTKNGVVSPDGRCRPFDAGSAGTVFTNGVGVVLLKRLTSALAAGNPIYAILKGSSVNNDASRKPAYSSPSIQGQADAVARALEVSGTPADTIGYVEAHGTGTELGDPVEVEALSRAFGRHTHRKGFCALGSVKGNIGHTDVAAGIAGFIKVCLMLQNRQWLPTAHFEQPNPRIELDSSPFFVLKELRAWSSDAGYPRRACVSSLGVGGTNAHAVLEEAPEQERVSVQREWKLFPLSARSEAALRESAALLERRLGDFAEDDLCSLSDTLISSRPHMEHRLFVAARNVAELQEAWRGNLSVRRRQDQSRPLVFMFPGQGSQYPNMARGWLRVDRLFRKFFLECCEMLQPLLGRDLREVVFPEDGRSEAACELDHPVYAQTSLFAIEYSIGRALIERGLVPAALIGHSAGEYAAAALSGIISPADAVGLLVERGRLQQACQPGAMLAVSLSEARIRAFPIPALDIAAINAESLVTVSGGVSAIEETEAVLRSAGIQAIRLKTERAFHSQLMDPILHDFRRAVERVRLRPPNLMVLSNLTGQPLTPEQAQDPEYWAHHLRSPVRFFPAICHIRETLHSPVFLEAGPGRALSGAAKSAVDPATVMSLLPPRQLSHNDASSALQTLGRLWEEGQPFSWRSFSDETPPRLLRLPPYPFARQRHWIAPSARAPEAKSERTLRTPASSLQRVAPEEWLYTPCWKQEPIPQCVEGGLGNWLLCGEGDIVTALAQRLRQSGHRVSVSTSQPETGDRMPRRPFLKMLQDENLFPQNVVFFARSDMQGETAEQLCFDLLQWFLVAQDLAPNVMRHLFLATTSGLPVFRQDMDAPLRAPLLSVVRGISQEHPHVSCKVIDTERGASSSAVIRQLMHELFIGMDHERVCYRGTSRWVETFAPITAASAASDASHPWAGKVFLIIGGLGKLGLAHARYLSGLPGVKLALIGRSVVPPREEWERVCALPGKSGEQVRQLLAMEQSGAQVRCYRGDVTSLEQMNSVWRDIEQDLGRVFCVVHAAGVDAAEHYRLLKDESRDRLHRLFSPKIEGLQTLDALARSRGTELCLVISSISSVIGGLGLAAYSACHSFLDSFVQGRQQLEHEMCTGSSPRWLAVNWDAWALEGEPNARHAYESSPGASLNRLALSDDDARSVLRRLCNLGSISQVIVSTAPLQERYRLWVRREFDEVPERREQELRPRPSLSSSYVRPTSDPEQKLARVWQQLLGIAEIGSNDNFFELGGDSLLAVQMTSLVEEQAGVSLTVTDVFEHPTIGKLSGACLSGSSSEGVSVRDPQSIESRAAQQRRAIVRNRQLNEAARNSVRGA